MGITQTMAYIDANKERYIADMKRSEIALRLGTYYVCARGRGGVITHKYAVTEE